MASLEGKFLHNANPLSRESGLCLFLNPEPTFSQLLRECTQPKTLDLSEPPNQDSPKTNNKLSTFIRAPHRQGPAQRRREKRKQRCRSSSSDCPEQAPNVRGSPLRAAHARNLELRSPYTKQLLPLGVALADALTILGIAPVYHMRDVGKNKHQDLWVEAIEAKFEGKGPAWTRDEFDRILSGYEVCYPHPFH